MAHSLHLSAAKRSSACWRPELRETKISCKLSTRLTFGGSSFKDLTDTCRKHASGVVRKRNQDVLTYVIAETADDLIKLACALTKRRVAASSKDKHSPPLFECAITNAQTRW